MKTIMICDNDTFNSGILKDFIEKTEGEFRIFEVRESKDIIPMIEKLKAKKIMVDAIFIEVKLGNNYTFNVVREINEKFPHIKKVLIGGSELTDENILKMTTMNVKDVVPKPYDYDQIVSLVETLG